MSSTPRPIAALALLVFALTSRRDVIRVDVARWLEVERHLDRGSFRKSFVALIAKERAFRDLLYHRVAHGNLAGRIAGKLCRGVLRGQQALFIACDDVGPGLYIQHGFATGIGAASIGANCWINQQVTIGYNTSGDAPVIEDDVTIYAGAKVLGPIRVGRGAIIGANAVVTKDVPPDTVAVGVPATFRPKRTAAQPAETTTT